MKFLKEIMIFKKIKTLCITEKISMTLAATATHKQEDYILIGFLKSE